MISRSMNALSLPEKLLVDKLVEPLAKHPRLRKEIRKKANPAALLEHMKGTIPHQTIVLIQQYQTSRGRAFAVAKFLDEIVRHECWAADLLDALHHEKLTDFARALYKDYVPPQVQTTKGTTTSLSMKRIEQKAPLPAYRSAQIEMNPNRSSDQTTETIFVDDIITRDQEKEYELLRNRRKRATFVPAAGVSLLPVVRQLNFDLFRDTCPTAHIVSNCQTSKSIKVKHRKASDIEREAVTYDANEENRFRSDRHLNDLRLTFRQCSRSTVSNNPSESDLSSFEEKNRLDVDHDQLEMEKALNFDNVEFAMVDVSKGQTTAQLSSKIRESSIVKTKQILAEKRRENSAANPEDTYLYSAEFAACASMRQPSIYDTKEICLSSF